MEPEEKRRPDWHLKKLQESVNKIDVRLSNIEKELHPDEGLSRGETIRVYKALNALVSKLKGVGRK